MQSSIQFTDSHNSECVITSFQYGPYIFPIHTIKSGKRLVHGLCGVKTELKEFLLTCAANSGGVDIHAVLEDGRKRSLIIKNEIQPFYFEVLFACHRDVERVCNAYVDFMNGKVCGW